MREPARRRTTAMVITGMVLGGIGAGAYVLLSRPDPPPPAKPAKATGMLSPESAARAVVDRLNAKDLDGVIELTCAQGKSTGRRELMKAIPQLDPASPEQTRTAPIEFELGRVSQFPDGYIATFTVRLDSAKHEGTMRIQRSADEWTLCGLDSPRIGGVG